MIAFPWNLADTGRIEGAAYAMAAKEKPWAPDARSKVLRMILELAGDMRLVSIDPRAGRLTLEGDSGQVIVWQNLPGWTDKPGAVWEVTLPAWARTAELWAWDGRLGDVRVSGGSATMTGLGGNETYMLRVPRPR